MNDHFVLDPDGAVRAVDVETWGRWFQTADRRIAWTEVGEATVSTVFLGLDHRFGSDGPPLIFETMIFGGPLDEHQARYSTLEQAKAGHEATVQRAQVARLRAREIQDWLAS